MTSTAKFWREQAARYNLEGTHCVNCGRFFYPPRIMCPACRRDGAIETYKFTGTGVVVTYTTVYQAPRNHNRQMPYTLAIIALDEGPRLQSEVICEPEAISIGMHVRAVFRRIGEEDDKGIIYYGTKFVPA
ncbi:MAG: Zn-ribbon domain-containing OB-fold protein [Candidatus Dadabacteria bacterium]|nr:Zn-ribbon domain-containing OB-fold protein [Candidatus Dadabacteria bacterium]